MFIHYLGIIRKEELPEVSLETRKGCTHGLPLSPSLLQGHFPSPWDERSTWVGLGPACHLQLHTKLQTKFYNFSFPGFVFVFIWEMWRASKWKEVAQESV